MFVSGDLLAVPVVDENEMLLGIVTVDDAMDILTLKETKTLPAPAVVDFMFSAIVIMSLLTIIVPPVAMRALLGTKKKTNT